MHAGIVTSHRRSNMIEVMEPRDDWEKEEDYGCVFHWDRYLGCAKVKLEVLLNATDFNLKKVVLMLEWCTRMVKFTPRMR